MGDLCDNIGLVLACLPSGSTNATESPSQYMTQPSWIPILSPYFLCMLAIPIFPLIKFIYNLYTYMYVLHVPYNDMLIVLYSTMYMYIQGERYIRKKYMY